MFKLNQKVFFINGKKNYRNHSGAIIFSLVALFLFLLPVKLLAEQNFIFNNNLNVGNVRQDVKELQTYLNDNGSILAKVSFGSAGKETTYFGRLTRAALIKFQKVNKITPAVGFFGKITRGVINTAINKKISELEAYNNQVNNLNPAIYYSIGGNISGLAGEVTLQNNGKDDLVIDPGGSGDFTFPTEIINGGSYFVTVTPDYSGYNCYLDESGVVNGANVTDLKLGCELDLAHGGGGSSSGSNSNVITHSLNYTASVNGSIAGAVSQIVNNGNGGATVTAVPDKGYKFVKWDDEVMTAERTDLNITANKTVTANFAINQYTLSYLAGDNGTITGTSTQAINYGGSGSEIIALANANYRFLKWSDDLLTATRTDVNIIEDKTLTAGFVLNSFALNYFAGANGTITGTSAQIVDYDLTGTEVTATPDSGYHFVSWSDNNSVTATRTDANVKANVNATSTFAIDTFNIETFVLNSSAGENGSITPSETVNYGSDKTFTITPAVNYYIADVLVDDVSVGAVISYTFTNVIATHTIFVTFAINTYTLTYIAGDNGTITGTSTQAINYGAGGSEVSAVPNVGHHFIAWSDGILTATRTDLNVTGNISVTADFTNDQYVLNYFAGVNGTITGTSTQTVNYDLTGTEVTATPNVGYRFINWSDNDSIVATRTDANVKANVNATSTFAINTLVLTYLADVNGTITGTSTQTIDYGANGSEVIAVSSAGYHFVNWSDGVVTANRTDLNVIDNISVTANFDVDPFVCGTSTIQGAGLDTLTYGTVVGEDKRCWLDRNLGATRLAISATDDQAYGWYYQWGRPTDGHQISNSGTQQGPVANVVPGTNTFITPNYEWSSIDSNGLIRQANWGVNGISNPCPVGWRIPTQAEWNTFVVTLGMVTAKCSPNCHATAFNSALKLTLTGYRWNNSAGLYLRGNNGNYWSSSSNGTGGYSFNFNSSHVDSANNGPRAVGFSARCLQNQDVSTYTLTYTAGDNGSLTGVTPQTINNGANGSEVIAVPNVGYHFIDWSDGVVTANRIDLNVVANISVTANFAINTFTLNYLAGVNGTITGTSTQAVNFGVDGTAVTAMPNAGYRFVKWSDEILTATRTDLKVLANLSVTANFAVDPFVCGTSVVQGAGLDMLTYSTVVGEDKRCWLDRNLGATRVAISATDDQAYGWYYQWGRSTDGHQIYSVNDITTTLSSTDTPGHNDFIYGMGSPYDWRSSQSSNATTLWAGMNGGSNNPCPVGWRVPTSAEWTTIANAIGLVTAQCSPNCHATAFNSALKLTLAGSRSISDATFSNRGGYGYYWSSSPSGWSAHGLFSRSSYVDPAGFSSRAPGFSVRCLQNQNASIYTLIYTAGDNGSLTGATPQAVNNGANGSEVIAVPNVGYHFIDWSDGVVTAGRTDLNVIDNISVTANFAINTFTLNYLAGVNGTITGTSTQTINFGVDGTPVTAVPNAGYRFVKWSDEVLTASRTDLKVIANLSVTANFGVSCGVTPIIYNGYSYPTVSMGGKCWFKENLRTIKYNDNTDIPKLTDNTQWKNDTIGSYYVPFYGGNFYNFYAVNTGKLCPTDWHIPTHNEFTDLERSVCVSGTCTIAFPYDVTTIGLRGSADEASKLTLGTPNASGFNVVFPGYRHFSGTYTLWNEYAVLWTSTIDGTLAWARYLYGNPIYGVWRDKFEKASGLSARCMEN